MKCKGAKSNEIVTFVTNQIRSNPKNVTLYTILLKEVGIKYFWRCLWFFQMIDGGLDASGKVVELERDTAIRSSLYKSPEYLSSVIRTKLQDSNNLAKKQIHLSHLKLQKGLLSSQDVLALDTLLNTVTDEARFKISYSQNHYDRSYGPYENTRFMVQVYFETPNSH